MENTSSSCSSKSIPCASNASANDTLSKSIMQETQNLDIGQEILINLDKPTRALKYEVWKDFHR